MVGRHVGRDGKVEGILYLYNPDQQNFWYVFCVLERFSAFTYMPGWFLDAVTEKVGLCVKDNISLPNRDNRLL